MSCTNGRTTAAYYHYYDGERPIRYRSGKLLKLKKN